MGELLSSLEADAAERIVGLFPPESARAALERIEMLNGPDGRAGALAVAQLDRITNELHRRPGFDLEQFRQHVVGRLGVLAAEMSLEASPDIQDLDA